ncbi:hypothetical protein SDC9_153358 [bioreactor metagenome]|uniref:Uncharacterized protein n=1 Tax=bioreactor metagenome TaxID=1076179 RepID=A0A645F0C2_9ZZZZ
MSPGLQPVRQKLRHFLLDGYAAGASLQQRTCLRLFAAEQNAGALRTIQPLVARHGDERRAQRRHIQRQDSGGLGCVDDEGYAPLPANGGNGLHRLHRSEDVGHVGADHRVHIRRDGLFKGLRRQVRPKQRGARHADVRRQRRQRPGDGVVLVPGDDDSPAVGNKAFDGDIQSVGSVHGEHHLLRLRYMKEFCQLRAAGKQRLGRLHGLRISAPPRRAHLPQGRFHRVTHRLRFLETGGRAVQIDHSQPPYKDLSTETAPRPDVLQGPAAEPPGKVYRESSTYFPC